MADRILPKCTQTLVEKKADNLSKILHFSYKILGFEPGISKTCDNRNPNVFQILGVEHLVFYNSWFEPLGISIEILASFRSRAILIETLGFPIASQVAIFN